MPAASGAPPARILSRPSGQIRSVAVLGPYVYTSDYYSPRRAEWERLVREREHCPDTYRGDPIKIDHCIVRTSEQIAAIDAKDLADAQAYHQRQALRVRAVELARARTLDFAGAPGVQMVLAGRLWGHCCNCGRALTDPISLERGIGPECHAGKVDFIKRMRAEMSVARLGVSDRRAGGLCRRRTRRPAAGAKAGDAWGVYFDLYHRRLRISGV